MQQIVMPFNGAAVEVVRDEQGKPLVGVRSVCDAIGVSSNNQILKLSSDPKFNRYDVISVAADGKERRVFCIPLDQLNGWLFSINSNKVPEHVRPNLVAYQQECFEVLYKHFMPNGAVDLQPLMDKITEVQKTCSVMNTKFDYLIGMDLTVFGDDAPAIKELIEKTAKTFNISHNEVWGMVRRECDVSSYKLQNRKVINFLRNLLGEGIRLVDKTGEQHEVKIRPV
jgi:hypothetical protein